MAHIQLMTGMVLYTQSPVVKYFWKETGDAVRQRELTFYGLIHLILMLTAITVLTIGSASAKRKATDKEKFKTMWVWFSIALLLIFMAVPWPFFPLVRQTLLQNILRMKKYFTTSTGRLRLLAFLEGLSLLVLVFIAVPLKYYFSDPSWVKAIGPVHGALFLLFVFNALRTGVEQQWKFTEITWNVLVACIVPFGTFYIDYKVLRHLQGEEN
ncbi:MAG: DUF3817 domain-containing protein [Leadbetterella sp.]|nr:DUF3817 domain-containing protein [Leadbetterella sp.]